jgi:integrase
MRLTDFSLRAFPAPEKGQRLYYDDSLPAFGCRVSQGGTRAFFVQCGANRQFITIGRYPIISLAAARAEAKRILAENTLGKHRPRSIPFDEGKALFLEACKEKNRPRTLYDYTRLLDRHFKFGRIQLSEITAQDINKKLDRIAAPAERRYATVLIKSFFRWAYRKSYIDHQPHERLKVPKPRSRSRVLSDAELASIWRLCEGTFGTIVRLLILTGQRRGEIAALRNDFLAGDLCTLPSTLTKNRREHTFPLSKTASSIISGLSSGQGKQDLLFPSRHSQSSHFNGWSKCKKQLDAISKVGGWTLHDLRRTFATGLAELEVRPHVIERLLNHSSGTISGVAAIYNRYQFMDEMRDAISKWEIKLASILNSSTRINCLDHVLTHQRLRVA